MQDFNNSKGFYMKKDDLITRCKLLKGERDESIFTILIGGNDSNLLIVFYVQIMPDDFVMQLHRF
ncbi:hypothetical protein CVC31_21965 [Salmonella enterica subsp. enterica serovar Mbandaka]|nr:hypothetical protein [Salmonella enterica subsp. enterica serovar Mbandaka]EBF7539500.1 hypothetical protein [Salmonella enterica]ECK8665832.1 hypothetical protein [Salmonella enterica subsp. enterica serovar Schwarzengrund]MIF47788.1 hypothetical protein [Salmonella enterica subsp. enterica serovar Schwarzengrund]